MPASNRYIILATPDSLACAVSPRFGSTTRFNAASSSPPSSWSGRAGDAGPRRPPHAARGCGRPGVSDVAARTEFIVELLDLQNRQVVARATLQDHVVGGFLGPDRLYGYEEDPALAVIVWQLGVVRPARE